MKPDANPYGSITCVRFTGYNLSRPNPDGTPLSVFVIANIRIIRRTLVIKQFFSLIPSGVILIWAGIVRTMPCNSINKSFIFKNRSFVFKNKTFIFKTKTFILRIETVGINFREGVWQLWLTLMHSNLAMGKKDGLA